MNYPLAKERRLYLAIALPALLAPRQGLVATQDGLMGYRGLSFSFIPWSEALLIVVVAAMTHRPLYDLR